MAQLLAGTQSAAAVAARMGTGPLGEGRSTLHPDQMKQLDACFQRVVGATGHGAVTVIFESGVPRMLETTVAARADDVVALEQFMRWWKEAQIKGFGEVKVVVRNHTTVRVENTEAERVVHPPALRRKN